MCRELFLRVSTESDMNNYLTVIHSREEVARLLRFEKSKEQEKNRARFFTFPGLQEVCDAEVDLLIKDDDA